MQADPMHALVIALSAPERRDQAAAALAEALGCESMWLFVRDATLGVLLPAPGMPKTFAGGARWRAFLDACIKPGRHEALVDLPVDSLRPATALSHGGVAAVLVGGAPREPGLETLRREMPLLEALLRTEQALKIGNAEALDARDAAGRAQTLAKALDASRAAAADLNQRLRREHARKDEFLAMLAHELRNPLSPLVNSIEILRRVDLAAPLAQRQIDVMARQLGQLTRLVDDLLDVSRVSRGLIGLRREILPLSELLRVAIDSARPALAERGHRLQALGIDGPVHVNGDRVRLTQVFANLLHNAVKYTDAGGVISISVVPDGTRVSVVLRDTGIGIPPAMLSRVFELFTQVTVAPDRAHGGLGIGLTLVKTLVELHGGHVSAHSVGLGHGSTFTVSLPLVAAPIGTAVPAPAPVTAAVPVQVLVVDDSQDNAESLAEVLRMMGAQVQVACTGPQAIAAAAKLSPALVMLDIGLPGMDGYETARHLRSQATRPLKLVALTGYGSADDRERSRAAGFDAHLVKPAPLAELEKLLRSVQEAAGEAISLPTVLPAGSATSPTAAAG
jgi:signal transduction histidine kinase/ActR/RegA family two-component response regulator